MKQHEASGPGKAVAAVVGIEDLRVVISNDEDCWVAQAIELDYCAAGESEIDVQERFEHGLRATIQCHLERYGDLKRFLKAAPLENWVDLLAEDGSSEQSFTQVSFHIFTRPTAQTKFPFRRIAFYRKPEPQALVA